MGNTPAKKAPAKKAAAKKTPADRRRPSSRSGQKLEATDELVTFPWEDEQWEIRPSSARSLQFLAGLTDAEDGDVTGMIRALRILLGNDQAARLFEVVDRDLNAGWSFLAAAGKAANQGNS